MLQKKSAKQLVERSYRTELPKAQNQLDKDRQAVKKKDAALVAAETMYRSLTVNELIGVALLENSSKMSLSSRVANQQHADRSHSEISKNKLNKNSAVGRLYKDSAHLKELGIDLVDAPENVRSRPAFRNSRTSSTKQKR